MWANEGMPVADLLSSVRREISFRKRLYPRWIREKKMQPYVADLELRRIIAVRERLFESEALRLVVAGLAEKLGLANPEVLRMLADAEAGVRAMHPEPPEKEGA